MGSGPEADAEFTRRCRALIEHVGLCDAHEVTSVRRLAGGVASDIAVVSFRDKSVCVKFALHKLKVNQDWFAPVHRGRAEYAWLQVAGDAAAGAAPKLYGWSDSENGFAMEFIDGGDVYLWKTSLLAGNLKHEEATRVATTVGTIHQASTSAGFDHALFDNRDDFDALRIEPYLRFTARQHPELADRITRLGDALFHSRIALVHGDISPKNILFRRGQPVILDAECATIGDPAFDVAFCLNHLVLKSFHLPDLRQSLYTGVREFWKTYSALVSWETTYGMESRVSALIPVLMLARIDGKSPVEYLSHNNRGRVRTAALSLINDPATNIREMLARIQPESAR